MQWLAVMSHEPRAEQMGCYIVNWLKKRFVDWFFLLCCERLMLFVMITWRFWICKFWVVVGGFWLCRYIRILERSMELCTRRLRYLLDTDVLIRNHGVNLISGIIIFFTFLCFSYSTKITTIHRYCIVFSVNASWSSWLIPTLCQFSFKTNYLED